MHILMILAAVGSVVVSAPPLRTPSADDPTAQAPAEDIARLPDEHATDRLVFKACTSRGVCTKRYESRDSRGDGTVTIIENGDHIQIVPEADRKPK